MKIALINPDSPGLIDPKVFPPLGILYLSAVLKQAGHEVEVLDFAGQGSMKLPVFDYIPDIVGITATTPQFPQAVHINKYLQENGIHTMIGGPHATVDTYMREIRDFTAICRGESEKIIKTITETINMVCPGQIYRAKRIDDLDSIPFPDRDAIDLESYKYELDGRKTTNIISSRGCPYSCSFCCKSWGKKVRYRSVDNVITEAELLKEKYGYNALMFYDDEMMMNRERDWSIFSELNQLDITFRFFSRINLIKKRTPEHLKRLGCKQICFGIESGSDEILKNINKGFTIDQAKKVLYWCLKAELNVKLFIIIGLPGERQNTLIETEEFLDEVQPDDVDFTVLTVYPGSDIYNNPDKYDLKWKYEPNWYKTTPGTYKTNVSTKDLTSEQILERRDYLEEKFKKW
jgi:radical SAM superfamily enzyme YgiQ (UPF0313 family)